MADLTITSEIFANAYAPLLDSDFTVASYAWRRGVTTPMERNSAGIWCFHIFNPA